MPANKQWKRLYENYGYFNIFQHTLAAVAPLWKRLMVWHDDGVFMLLHVHVYVFYLDTTPENSGYIHIDIALCCVHKSLYSSCRIDIHGAIFFSSIRSFVCLDTLYFAGWCISSIKMPHTVRIEWQAKIIQTSCQRCKFEDNVPLYSGTCASAAIAHLFNPIRCDSACGRDTVFYMGLCLCCHDIHLYIYACASYAHVQQAQKTSI